MRVYWTTLGRGGMGFKNPRDILVGAKTPQTPLSGSESSPS